MRRKVGALILAGFLLFVTVSNLTVDREKLEKWEDINYWKDYPKRAYPSWLSTFRDLTPTVTLSPEVSEENGTFVYRFVYNHRASDKPNDVRFYGLSRRVKVEISVTRPDGIEVTLYRGRPVSENMSLNVNMKSGVESRISSVFGLSVESYILRPPAHLLFIADASFETLKGEYVFEVRSPEPLFPQMQVVGTCYGLMGTDSRGRDLWVGFVKAMNNTLFLAFFTAVFVVVLGVITGMVSGYVGGAVGEAVSFILEVLVTLPLLPMLVVLVWLFSTQGLRGQVQINPVVFMLLVAVMILGKLAKTIKMMTVKEKVNEYVKAAEVMGAGTLWVLRKHIFPPVLSFSARYFATLLVRVVALISLFGFFGLIPGTNWGSFMIEAMMEGAIYGGYWWWILPPGLAMAVLSAGLVLILPSGEVQPTTIG